MLLCLLHTQNCFQWNDSVAKYSSPDLVVHIPNTLVDFLNTELNEYCVISGDKRVIILEHRNVSQTCYFVQWIQLWFSENRILKIKLNEPSVFTEGAREKESLAVIHIADVVEGFVRLCIFTVSDIISLCWASFWQCQTHVVMDIVLLPAV